MPNQIVILYGSFRGIRKGPWLPVQALFTLFNEAEKPTYRRIGRETLDKPDGQKLMGVLGRENCGDKQPFRLEQQVAGSSKNGCFNIANTMVPAHFQFNPASREDNLDDTDSEKYPL